MAIQVFSDHLCICDLTIGDVYLVYTCKLESILTKRTQCHNNNGTNNKQLLNRAPYRYRTTNCIA